VPGLGGGELGRGGGQPVTYVGGLREGKDSPFSRKRNKKGISGGRFLNGKAEFMYSFLRQKKKLGQYPVEKKLY